MSKSSWFAWTVCFDELTQHQMYLLFCSSMPFRQRGSISMHMTLEHVLKIVHLYHHIWLLWVLWLFLVVNCHSSTSSLLICKFLHCAQIVSLKYGLLYRASKIRPFYNQPLTSIVNVNRSADELKFWAPDWGATLTFDIQLKSILMFGFIFTLYSYFL